MIAAQPRNPPPPRVGGAPGACARRDGGDGGGPRTVVDGPGRPPRVIATQPRNPPPPRGCGEPGAERGVGRRRRRGPPDGRGWAWPRSVRNERSGWLAGRGPLRRSRPTPPTHATGLTSTTKPRAAESPPRSGGHTNHERQVSAQTPTTSDRSPRHHPPRATGHRANTHHERQVSVPPPTRINRGATRSAGSAAAAPAGAGRRQDGGTSRLAPPPPSQRGPAPTPHD